MPFCAAIRNEPKLIKSEKKQIPYVGTNLSDIGRSFADPIKYKGFTEEYNERQRMWEYAHSESIVLHCSSCGWFLEVQR